MLSAAAAASSNAMLEVMLMQAVSDIRSGRLSQAERQIDQLIALHPNYRLAHLIKGDLLLARARALSGIGNVTHEHLHAQVIVPSPYPSRRPLLQSGAESVADLRAELLARVRHTLDVTKRDRLPEGLWRVAQDVPHVLFVDASRSRLYVFENRGGLLGLIADYYASVGKLGVGKLREGDRRTPTGTYLLTGAVARERLNDFYGGAAYELDFPSPWDVRLGRTGSGIWLHGTPASTLVRAPRASDGCIVVSNADLASIGRLVVPGRTLIVVADESRWVDRDTLARQSQSVLVAFEQWRGDFVSGDMARITQHYLGATSRSAETAPRMVNVSRTRPLSSGQVNVGNVSIVQVAGETGVATAMFDRMLGNHRDRVRQYWVMDHGRWRIAHESASLP